MKTLFLKASILVAALASVPFSAQAHGDDGYRYGTELVRYSDRYAPYCCTKRDPAWEAVRDVTRFWMAASLYDDRHRHEYRHHHGPRHRKHHRHRRHHEHRGH